MKKILRLFALTLLAGLVAAQPALRLKGLRHGVATRSSSFDVAGKTRTPGRSHLLVQFGANPSDDQLTALQNRGATLLSYVPDFAFSISASDDASFDGLDLQWIGRLQPDQKISPELDSALASGAAVSVVAEFYSDVDPNDARAIATDAGLWIQENPDLSANHLLLSGSEDQVLALTEWDEVAYVFPASAELVSGTPVRACVGALTSQGQVAQSVPLVGDGWDGPGRGGADLKYAFVHLTEKLPADSAKEEIARAFSEWAKYAKLTFSPSDNPVGAHTIAVLFASGAHGDPYPFDGRGGALAHTFYPFPVNPEPIAGDMHFDNDESWRIGVDVDLFSVALHETGHALGLGHSDKPGDVMYPYYRKTVGLSPDDIAAVLQLYAAQDGTPAPPQPPVAPVPVQFTLTVPTPASPTTASSLALSGTTAGGAGTVQVGWSTNGGYSGAAQGSANWSITGIPLNIGDNAITITARDSQQNQVTRTITVTRQQPNKPPTPPATGPDTTPPSLTIVSPSTASPSISSSSLIVSGTAHDNVGVAAVTWASSTGASGTATGTENWTTAPIPLYVGSTTITIRASDAAGNTSWRSLTVTRR
ncbi:MAG TPA: matrixin family metalloprotease [Bryobacteraceae bacterium]|nr:matrixin family metalloprotease [Bryobacteraceae bacterium]